MSYKKITPTPIAGNIWFQATMTLPAKGRGCHLITEHIEKVKEIEQYKVGLCHILLLHTSASLTLNENWDPAVRSDMEMMLNHIAPEEGNKYTHTCEGPDDMPAHVKSTLIGNELTLPIHNGKLTLGRWQGLWLCEHRNCAGTRKIVITLNGVPLNPSDMPK